MSKTKNVFIYEGFKTEEKRGKKNTLDRKCIHFA